MFRIQNAHDARDRQIQKFKFISTNILLFAATIISLQQTRRCKSTGKQFHFRAIEFEVSNRNALSFVPDCDKLEKRIN
jgi:hypothetical protein